MTFVQWRREKGMTMREVARALGTTAATIGNLEKGLSISNRLAIRIFLFSGGKVEIFPLILPNYDEVVREEKAKLKLLMDTYSEFEKAVAGTK